MLNKIKGDTNRTLKIFQVWGKMERNTATVVVTSYGRITDDLSF